MGEEDWTAAGREALTKMKFAITTPTLTDSVADRLRRYVFELVKQHRGYFSREGCVGKLAKCHERFDLQLRFTPEVAEAANQFVAATKPLLSQTLGKGNTTHPPQQHTHTTHIFL